MAQDQALSSRKTTVRPFRTLLLLFAALTIALFFGGFLTGSERREFHAPYSRLVHVQTRRYGFNKEWDEPNVMSAFYKTLKEPKEPADTPAYLSGDSYTIPPGFGRQKMLVVKPPPVTKLEPAKELVFLQALKEKKLQKAVIRSLFLGRKMDGELKAQEYNEDAWEIEEARCARILNWYEFVNPNSAVFFSDWWRDNAKVFGLTEAGDPLPMGSLSEQAAILRNGKDLLEEDPKKKDAPAAGKPAKKEI